MTLRSSVFGTATALAVIFFLTVVPAQAARRPKNGGSGGGGSLPAAPTNLWASAASSGEIDLSWTNTATNATGFTVEQATSSAGPWSPIGTTTSTWLPSTGLAPSTTYYYRVRAYNTAGSSGYSNTAGAKTQSSGSGGSLPAAPTNLWASAASSGEIDLSWTNNASDASGFTVELATSFYGPWVPIATTSTTWFPSTSLAASTTYYYRVSAYNTVGSSEYSNTAGATTLGGSTVPAAPSNLSAGAVSSSQINLSWTNTATNASGFTVEQATSSAGPWSQIGTMSSPSYASAGLSASTTYYYRVSAYNTMGSSGYSNTAGATTLGGSTGPTGSWGRGYGSTLDDRGRAVAVDGNGNIIATGHFQGTVDFGGGPLTSAGGADIFIAKYSPVGVHLWSRRFGGVSDEHGVAIAVDGSGNVVVTGDFQGTVDFGGGPLTSAGMSDIFVAKFSSAGAHLWSRRFGGDSDQFGEGVAVDSSGNIIVTGSFWYTVDFGGGPLSSAGATDIFVAKFSPAGAHLWSKRFGGPGYDYGHAVAVDGSGSVVVTGDFAGTVDLGGGPLTASYIDIFVAKYSAAGAHLWSQSMGKNTGINRGWGVAVDRNNDVVVAGSFQGSVDFGGGALVGQGTDAFVVKYAGSSGAYLWSHQLGGPYVDEAYAVGVDGTGNVVVTGYFQYTGDFLGTTLTAISRGLFVTKLSPAGAAIWSKSFGGPYDGFGEAIGIDGVSGNIAVTGYFLGTIDLGFTSLTTAGYQSDILLFVVQ